MENDYIDFIQPPPKPKTKKCRLLIRLASLLLSYGSLLISTVVFFYYDLFIGFVSFLIMYIITGIIRSKIRLTSIPSMQLEYNYSDYEITSWYFLKYICFEDNKKNTNLPSV